MDIPSQRGSTTMRYLSGCEIDPCLLSIADITIHVCGRGPVQEMSAGTVADGDLPMVPAGSPSPLPGGVRRFRFSIDRGGTFTDVYAEIPAKDGSGVPSYRVLKLLSEDPGSYPDAPREAIRRILEEATSIPHPKDKPLDTSRIEWIRMGTTVATNALLERKGERTAFITTKGFKDLLHIGNQSRPRIFDLVIARPENVYETVVEVDERVLVHTDKEGGKQQPPTKWVEKHEFHTGVTGEKVSILKKPDLEKLQADLQKVKEMGIKSLAVSLAHSYTYPEHEKLVGELAAKMGFTHISLSSSLMPMVKLVPRSYTACADAYLTPCIHKYLTQFRSGFDEHMERNTRVWFMQSDGGLVPVDKFSGFRAVLSGPAGGVVGYAQNTPIKPRHGEADSDSDAEVEADKGEDESKMEMDTASGTNAKKPAKGSAATGRASPKSKNEDLSDFSVAEEAVIGFDMGGTSTDVSRYSGRYEHVFEVTT
jgi:5-oxoprolinase (ATP-hydrolysing)